MYDWNDEGILLDKKKYSDIDGIASFFSKNHGYIRAFCGECFSKRRLCEFQIGNLFDIRYCSKTNNLLGNVSCNFLQNYSNIIFNDLIRLNVINSVCALLKLLPENENNTLFYSTTKKLLINLHTESFLKDYALWELDLLSTLGFGLDLSKCALTGSIENLRFVSPKTGRAVCEQAAIPWKDKLLKIPAFFVNKNQKASLLEIKKALFLTGFFLENQVSKALNCAIPNTRNLLINSISEVQNV